MSSITDKINILKSYEQAKSFPVDPVTSASHGVKAGGVTRSIEKFLNENQRAILKTVSLQDLKAIESTLQKLHDISTKPDTLTSLVKSIQTIQTIQQLKLPASSTSINKPISNPTGKTAIKSRDALLKEIQDDIKKIDLGSFDLVKSANMIRAVNAKVFQLKQHPDSKKNDPEIENMRMALEMVENQATFLPDSVEKSIVSTLRNDGVQELEKVIDSYLERLKNVSPDLFPQLKEEFIAVLNKYKKKEHLAGSIAQIIFKVKKMTCGGGQQPVRKQFAKVLKTQILDCSMYDRSEKTLANEAAKNVLKLLKQNISSPREDFLDKLMNIQSEITKQRIATISSRDPSFDVNRNLSTYIEKMGKAEKKCQTYLEDKIARTYEEYDRQSEGNFSRVIKNYSYADLNSLKDDLPQIVLKAYFRSIKSNVIVTDQKLHAKIDSYLESKKNLHIWFLANHSNIQKSYDQGEDLSYSLSGGTCLQNSYDRLIQLVETPEITAQSIDVRSTQEGRYAQARSNAGLSQYKTVAPYLQKKGFRITDAKELNTPAETTPSKRYVIDQLFNQGKIPAATQGAFLLEMRHRVPGGGSGHAINVQFDRARGIYRFIDDNVGIVSYKTADAFKKGLETWLETACPELEHYRAIFINK